MTLSRRAFLAAQGAAAGAVLVPGRLLAALEAATPPTPALDDWAKVRGLFRLSPDYLHLAGFFIASHPAPVRDAIESWRRAIDENPFLTVDGGLFEDEAKRSVQSRVREAAAAYISAASPTTSASPRTPPRASRSSTTGFRSSPGRRSSPPSTTTPRTTCRSSTPPSAPGRRSGRFPLRRSREGHRGRDLCRPRPGRSEAGHPGGGRHLGPLAIRDPAPHPRHLRRPRRAQPEARRPGPHPPRRRRRPRLRLRRRELANLGADFFCAGTHKWIYGPRGTGLLWARPEAWARLRPLIPTFSEEEPYDAFGSTAAR